MTLPIAHGATGFASSHYAEKRDASTEEQESNDRLLFHLPYWRALSHQRRLAHLAWTMGVRVLLAVGFRNYGL